MPHLIITDNDMPVMTGYAAVCEIRKTYDPKVIFITTRAPEDEYAFAKANLHTQRDQLLELVRKLLQ